MVLFVIVMEELSRSKPPPESEAVLPEIVLLIIVDPKPSSKIPPPREALLPRDRAVSGHYDAAVVEDAPSKSCTSIAGDGAVRNGYLTLLVKDTTTLSRRNVTADSAVSQFHCAT